VKTLKVLLVEHEGDDAARVREALAGASGAQFEFLHLERASEACERLREEQFDVVLLDPTLPDDWGFDSLVRIRAQAPLTPLVVLTSLDDQEFAREAVEAGAADAIPRERITSESLANALVGAVQRHLIGEAIERRAATDRVASSSSAPASSPCGARALNRSALIATKSKLG
jgi:Response regulator containing CheY-like receiver domain and AraC-type DNA-binding domain